MMRAIFLTPYQAFLSFGQLNLTSHASIDQRHDNRQHTHKRNPHVFAYK